MKTHIKKSVLILGALVCISFFSFFRVASAATLYIAPASKNISVGDTFSVGVFVDTQGASVNAFSGSVSYPANMLSLVSATKTNSIVNVWTTEPSGGNGNVRYEGIVLNPGYTGTSGKIASITFKARASGTATISLALASVLANDGLGTNVLSDSKNATLTIGKKQSEVSSVENNNIGLPVAPQITSTTHPDQTKWYANNVPKLSWVLPVDANGLELSFDHNATAVRGVHLRRVFSEYTSSEKLSDGVWYAHIGVHNDVGYGPMGNYRLGIDTTPPSLFTITPVADEAGTDSPYKKFTFSSVDTTSGVVSYSVSIDGSASISWVDDGAGIFTTPALSSGSHTLSAEAIDGAGNTLSSSVTFDITTSEKPKIESPVSPLQDGDFLTVSGHAIPNTELIISVVPKTPENDILSGTIFSKEAIAPSDGTVLSDKNGLFTFAFPERIHHANYEIFAKEKTTTGGYSAKSDAFPLVVNRTISESIVAWTLKILSIILSPIGLFLPLVLIAGYLYYRNRLLEREVEHAIKMAAHRRLKK